MRGYHYSYSLFCKFFCSWLWIIWWQPVLMSLSSSPIHVRPDNVNIASKILRFSLNFIYWNLYLSAQCTFLNGMLDDVCWQHKAAAGTWTGYYTLDQTDSFVCFMTQHTDSLNIIQMSYFQHLRPNKST